MINNYSFQIDITDPSSWNIFHRLQSVFYNANPMNPTQTFEAVQHVLGDVSIIDHCVHPDSPRRDRPAYLDDPNESFMDADERPTLFEKAAVTASEDWGAVPRAAPASKGWSNPNL